jgi:CRP/FNR family transcriptional regulator, anaerobic regulatory protein
MGEIMESAVVSLQAYSEFRHVPESRPKPLLRDVSRIQALCSTCKLRDLCLSDGLDAEAMRQIDAMVTTRLSLRKGTTLFRAGTRFTSLYAIRSGSCKTVVLSADGQSQVAGYHMAGDIIGSDGIGTGAHGCEAVMLEDTEVCALPFQQIEDLSRRDSRVQRNMHRLLSREITRERNVMMLLGSMRAEQRLASFLLDLSARYQERGYSSREFVLRMTREEIGSYLGLKLETVSRLFSRFQREGLIQVQGRVVKLLDQPMLKEILNGAV